MVTKILGRMLLVVSQVAMLLIWTGIIAWAILFMYDSWANRSKAIGERWESAKNSMKGSRPFKTINGR